MNISKLKSDIRDNRKDIIWGFVMLFVVNNFTFGSFSHSNIFAILGGMFFTFFATIIILLVILAIGLIPYFIFKQDIKAYRFSIIGLGLIWFIFYFL